MSNAVLKEKLATGLAELRAELGTPRPFPGSEYPYPLNQALAGALDVEELRTGHPEYGAIRLAEAVAACQPEHGKLFIPDSQVRAFLLRLNAGTGWALLWGGSDPGTARLAALLEKERFAIFSALPPGGNPSVSGGRDLGSHLTAPVYFLQALARYGLIYGRVAPGDDHGLQEFLEDHSPAVVLVTRDALAPSEEAMLQEMTDLGIPIIVAPGVKTDVDLPRAGSLEEMLDMALALPTMRVRRQLRYALDMPFPFDYSYFSEKIEDGSTIGGTPLSFLSLRPEDHGDGIEVLGEIGPDIGIELFVGDRRVDITASEYLEEIASALPAYIQGVACEVKEGCPTIRWRSGIALEARHIGQALYHGLKAEFQIRLLKVRLVFDKDQLPAMKQAADAFRSQRSKAVAAATEESEPYFYGCFRCHSFAVEHACIITPERPPQCGSRTWGHVKARALLSDYTSGGPGGPRVTPTRNVPIRKGRLLDPLRGEWGSANLAAQRHTQGHLKRVFLHSIFGYPHSACSCFQALAFHIPQVDGIGIMDRGFRGQAPDGRSWDILANASAGKQSSGYMAMGRLYLKSAKFLQGDGGWSRVVWMPRELKDAFAADKSWIATEADAPTLDQLEEFLRRQGWAKHQAAGLT